MRSAEAHYVRRWINAGDGTRSRGSSGPTGSSLRAKRLCEDTKHEGERAVGIKFQAMLLAHAEGGSLTQSGNQLSVENADAVTLFLAASTSFKPRDMERDLLAAKRNYADLKKRHVDDYQRFFQRVKLSLGSEAAPDLPTDERLKRVTDGASDLHLVEQYFQFGRYLLISCSRPGNMAATLQGLWNDKLDPSWDSKYTININTEMNYWPAEVTNLSELHEPLFDLIDWARPDGRRIAKAIYGARGFVLHHNTDIWGDAVPIDGVGSGLWAMGGAWEPSFVGPLRVQRRSQVPGCARVSGDEGGCGVSARLPGRRWERASGHGTFHLS